MTWNLRATVYYNLKLCYKQGEIAKAILNYERALLLHPGDNDIKYNDDGAKRPRLTISRYTGTFPCTLV